MSGCVVVLLPAGKKSKVGVSFERVALSEDDYLWSVQARQTEGARPSVRVLPWYFHSWAGRRDVNGCCSMSFTLSMRFHLQMLRAVNSSVCDRVEI
jgi:hypothetical protein